MSERLAELHRKVGATRRRLEEVVRRLAALRARLQTGAGAQGAEAPDAGSPVPLFQGLGSAPGGLEDAELHFVALDTEDPKSDDPKREER